MNRPLRPHAVFDHGPEHPDEVTKVPGVGFVPRTADEILESSAFKYRFSEQIVDRMTDDQWAILARYIYGNDELEAGRFLAELARPVIGSVVRWIKDDDRLIGRHVAK